MNLNGIVGPDADAETFEVDVLPLLRLSRNAHRIEQPGKAVSYLRSIVLNLARDHNRRGLVSL